MKRLIILFAIMLYTLFPATSHILDNSDKNTSSSGVDHITANYPPEELSSLAILDDARPNPAKGSTWIGYTLPEQSHNVLLVVRNLLGSIVYNNKIDADSQGFSLDVSNLNNGIYIYTLTINNHPVKSKRLVVSN